VVTAGDQGCYWKAAGDTGVHHVPAHKVKVVDTTGCGDVFHGVFCHAIAKGLPVDEAIRWATAGAAVKAGRIGGWIAVPNQEEIQQMLQTRN